MRTFVRKLNKSLEPIVSKPQNVDVSYDSPVYSSLIRVYLLQDVHGFGNKNQEINTINS